MRVAVIMHVPASDGGGGFYELKSQSELLSLYGLEIHVYEPYSEYHPSINGNIIYHDYKSHVLHFLKKWGKPGAYPLFLNINLQERYDIIYTFSPFYLLFLLVNRRDFKNSRKIIISTKDLLFPEKKAKKILRYFTIAFYRILRIKNLYLYNENNVENLMFKELNVKTYEVPPLVDKNILDYQFKKNDKFTVLFLGSVEKRKGAEMLFQILKKFENSNIIFKIAGSIDEGYVEMVKKLTSKNIIFLGSVDEETKNCLLFNSDIGLMLSLEESYSLVMREMLLHGLPLITTWSPAVEIFGDYGIAYLTGVKSIYERIMVLKNEYLNSNEKYLEWRESVLVKYNRKFNKEDLEKRFLHIFDI